MEGLDPSRWLDLEELGNRLVTYLPNVFVAALIVFGAWLLVRLTRKPLKKALRHGDFAPALLDLLVDKLYKYAVLAMGVIMAAGQLGINLTAALGTLGVAGLALGFAAQDSLSNMIAGLMIFWDKPFRVGHYITTSGSLYGRVEEITLRTTRIRTKDNTYVVIPNADLIDDAIVNHSMHGVTRVRVPVGIAYKEGIDRARQVILEAVAEVDGVLGDPEPAVVVEELAGSSVNLSLRVWVDDAEQERPVFFRCLERAKLALDEAEIEIPFPHLQLFVDDVQQPVWDKLSALPQLTDGGGHEARPAEVEAR